MKTKVIIDTRHYKTCENCGQPMIGIMKTSGDKAPRKNCAPCVKTSQLTKV